MASTIITIIKMNTRTIIMVAGWSQGSPAELLSSEEGILSALTKSEFEAPPVADVL